MAEPQNLNTGEWLEVKLSKSAGAGPRGFEDLRRASGLS